MNKNSMLSRFFPHKDGWYLIIVIEIAQIIALLGALPGYISIRLNAEFNEQQARILADLMPFLVLTSFMALVYISWRLTRSARKRLDELAAGSSKSKPEDEFNAWREITSLTMRYGIAAVVVIFLFNVVPAALIASGQTTLISSPFQPTSINSPTPAYILLGGIAAILGSVILAVLLMDRFTRPFRLLLVPSNFETQLKARSGALLTGKFLVLILGLITIGVLLVVPIGYQQTVRILYSEVSSLVIFADLRTQSLLFSVLALLLGAGYTYYASKSISDPIRELIQTFDKIEKGDLSVRAPISATDELGIVTMQFNRTVARLETLQSTLEQQVAERTKLLSATNEVARVASSSLDPDTMLTSVINLFTEQFGYYFAAFYFLDPSEKWAELKEATGDAGKLLKQNHHRLEVLGKSMVGGAIREKSARIAQIASEEKQRFENPLLPYTRSEIALPLIVGSRILGALNVQSTKESDFGPDAINTMQNMAGQVAVALENARLFQEAQQNIREMRTIQQQYLLAGWSGLSSQPEELEYGVGDESDGLAKKIEVSISLRDQVLGQIKLEGNDEWSPEQRSLVDAVATQAAIALENARLVSESRQIALRERMLAEINTKIWSSATIDGVLQTVVKELGRRLDASRATIELEMEDPS
jgi:GAF domain-containing protein/HAMP domain-containing protein